MKITEISVYVCCPDRNFVTVKIQTDLGLYGLGDGTLNGRELAVNSYIQDHIAPCLIGRDPRNIEDIWQYLYKGAYWRKGPVTMTAIGAIDMALWDLFGKYTNQPVYQLLGGKSRKSVKLYAHANGSNVEEVIEETRNHINNGFEAVRLQCAVPGLDDAYGILGDKKNYYEMQGNRSLPPEQIWNTKKYLNFIPNLFKIAREEFGENIDLLHDVHSRLTPIEAIKLCKELEPYNLLFVEDIMPSENQVEFPKIRPHSSTPLAIGETFNTIWDAKTLIESNSIDYIRCAVSHFGGITPLRRLADFASLYHIRTAPHGAPDLSPISHMAHLHFNYWVPNFGIQEFVGLGTEKVNSVFTYKMHINNGHMSTDDSPGLGVDFDFDAAKKLPYKRSYLPVSRLEDGTIWDW